MPARVSAPSRAAIIKAQLPLIWSLPNWDGDDTCWACGMSQSRLQKAHILSHCSGGSSVAENFFLLCRACHGAQPDGAARSIQLKWIHTVPHYMETQIAPMRAALLAVGEEHAEAFAVYFKIRLPSLWRSGAVFYSNRLATQRAVLAECVDEYTKAIGL